jgi:hypothetical protein
MTDPKEVADKLKEAKKLNDQMRTKAAHLGQSESDPSAMDALVKDLEKLKKLKLKNDEWPPADTAKFDKYLQHGEDFVKVTKKSLEENKDGAAGLKETKRELDDGLDKFDKDLKKVEDSPPYKMAERYFQKKSIPLDDMEAKKEAKKFNEKSRKRSQEAKQFHGLLKKLRKDAAALDSTIVSNTIGAKGVEDPTKTLEKIEKRLDTWAEISKKWLEMA